MPVPFDTPTAVILCQPYDREVIWLPFQRYALETIFGRVRAPVDDSPADCAISVVFLLYLTARCIESRNLSPGCDRSTVLGFIRYKRHRSPLRVLVTYGIQP